MNENTEDDDKHQASHPAATEDWEDCLTFTAKSSRKYFKLIVYRFPPRNQSKPHKISNQLPRKHLHIHTHIIPTKNRIQTHFLNK